MNATQVGTGLIGDPAVALLVGLQHAQNCYKICRYANCIDASFLLFHCEKCALSICQYPHCGLARIVLAHSRKQHAFLPWCPLCMKTVQQLPSSLNTVLDYCIQNGINPRKRVADCEVIPVHRKQLKLAPSTQPDESNVQPYTGKDYFADLPGDVLRKICGNLRGDNSSLYALQFVNHRVRQFFQYSREIRGLYRKKTLTFLRIEQLLDGSVLLQFRNCLKDEGFMHVCGRNGHEERFFHSVKRSDKAHIYINAKYGLMPHTSCTCHRRTRLFPQCYKALSLALEMFGFTNLFLGSILIDDALKAFITAHNKDIDFGRCSKNVERCNSIRTTRPLKNSAD